MPSSDVPRPLPFQPILCIIWWPLFDESSCDTGADLVAPKPLKEVSGGVGLLRSELFRSRDLGGGDPREGLGLRLVR